MGQAAKRSTTLGAQADVTIFNAELHLTTTNESRGVPRTKGNKIRKKNMSI